MARVKKAGKRSAQSKRTSRVKRVRGRRGGFLPMLAAAILPSVAEGVMRKLF